MITSFPDFLNYCITLRGQTLYTIARKKPFSVEVIDGVLWFIPLNTGKRRKEHPDKIESVISLLNKTGSSSSGIYHEVTFNASYILAIANSHKNE